MSIFVIMILKMMMTTRIMTRIVIFRIHFKIESVIGDFCHFLKEVVIMMIMTKRMMATRIDDEETDVEKILEILSKSGWEG